MTQTIAGTGSCRKCGLQKTSVNKGDPICLNCDMPENKPSGLVVNVKDPGHDTMMAIEAGKKISSPIQTTQKIVSSDLKGISIAFSLEELEIEDIQELVDLVSQKICNALDEMPFTCMKDAKRVMKIQELLEAK